MKFEVIDQKNIGKLRKSFIEAANDFSKPKKNGDNTYVGSKYNTLTDVFDACKEELKNHGFVISQDVETSDDGKLIKVTTYLIHELGTITFKALSIPAGKQDAQRFGSAITYARRYSLTANLGLTAEDDDGNVASNRDNSYQSNNRNYGNNGNYYGSHQNANRNYGNNYNNRGNYQNNNRNNYQQRSQQQSASKQPSKPAQQSQIVQKKLNKLNDFIKTYATTTKEGVAKIQASILKISKVDSMNDLSEGLIDKWTATMTNKLNNVFDNSEDKQEAINAK